MLAQRRWPKFLGSSNDEALTLGRAVAGLNAYSKGVSLGLFQPTPKEIKEQRRKMRKEETVTVDLLHRAVPAKHTDEGLRALSIRVMKVYNPTLLATHPSPNRSSV